MTQTIINVPAAGAFDPTDIEITDNTSGAFLIKDDSGSPTEYMRIDTTSGAELTKFVVHDDGANFNKFVVATDRSGSELINVTSRNTGLGGTEGVFFQGSPSTQVWVTGPSVFRLQNCNFAHNMTGAQNATTYLGTAADWIVTRGSPSEEMIKFEHDSNATFTLDGASAAVFKVVDSNATPKTYLSITESTQSYAADPYVHKVTLGDNNGYWSLGNGTLRSNAMQGGATALYGPASYLYGHTIIGITTNQTYGDFDPCQTPYTFTMGAAATGNVTIDSGFTVRGDYQTGSGQRQSFPVLWVFQNDNATHNFILSFDGGTTGFEHTKSGDTDAAAFISAAGLTLTPGQRYIVKFQKITNELLLIESVDKH